MIDWSISHSIHQSTSQSILRRFESSVESRINQLINQLNNSSTTQSKDFDMNQPIDENAEMKDEENITHEQEQTRDEFVISANENDVISPVSSVQPVSPVQQHASSNARIDLRDTATDARPVTELRQSPPSSPSEPYKPGEPPKIICLFLSTKIL